MNQDTIKMERSLHATPERVWHALTDKNAMKKWYFDIEDFKPELHAEFQFSGGTEEKQYKHLCKIIELIPEKKLAYSWRYEGYPGESMVTFDLQGAGDYTRLNLTHEGVTSFPDDNPDFAKENFVMGWDEIIGKNLKDFVEVPLNEKA